MVDTFVVVLLACVLLLAILLIAGLTIMMMKLTEVMKKSDFTRLKKEEERIQNIKLQLEKANSDNAPVISAEEISRARALETKRLLAEEKMLEAKRDVPEGVVANLNIYKFSLVFCNKTCNH